MTTNLSPTTVTTVKATIPALEEHGVEIIKTFYKTLFEKYPVSAGFFNTDRAAPPNSKHADVPPQVAALGGAVIAYAKNIEDISPLLPVVKRICHKHVSRGVVKPHYNLVGDCLLSSISSVLGPDVATEGVLGAWTEAYQCLANAFVDIETQIRDEAVKSAGYRGYADFEIEKVTEHSCGKTFTLMATPDGPATPPHSAGQYLSFKVENVEGIGKAKTSANLSDVVKDRLVFTVTPADERPVRHMLTKWKEGDVISTSVPCGPYTIDASKVAALHTVAVLGKVDDFAVMMSVANDVVKNVAKSVDELVFVVEHDGECMPPFSVPGEFRVEIVSPISPSLFDDLAADKPSTGVFVAPSVRHAMDMLPPEMYSSVVE